MRKLLLSASLLLLGAGIAQAQELFPLQAVGNGCLTGSYCPSGYGAWVNDLDEHFTSPTSTAFTIGGDTGGIGGNDHCSTTVAWNQPGIVITATDPSNNEGCTMHSTVPYSTPGYFEWTSVADEGGPLWQSQWLGVGIQVTDNVCGFGASGAEIDFPDDGGAYGPSPLPQEVPGFFFTNNYNGECEGGGAHGTEAYWGDATHVFGVDYGDGNALTFYLDGVSQGSFTPADYPGNTSLPNMEPGTCPTGSSPDGTPASKYCQNGNWLGEFWFSNHYNVDATHPYTYASTGMNILWVRHYHH